MASDALSNAIQSQSVESGKAMGSGGKAGGENKDEGLNDLYKVNQVYYRLPPTLSLVSKRTLLVNQSQRITYTNPYNDVITFIFNTGEFYTSMTTSYLYMEIGYNTPAFNSGVPNVPQMTGAAINPTNSYQFAKALISQGNALSLFEEIVFLSASGTEICREQNKGLESSVRFRYEHEQQYIDTIGQVQGAAKGSLSENYDGVGPVFDMSLGGNTSLNSSALAPIGGWETLVQPRSGPGSKDYFKSGVTNINNNKPAVSTTQYVSVAIPMDQILGCFKPYMNTLFPAGALSGGRLEMRLKNPTESMQFIAGCVEDSASNNYTNPYLTNLINANISGLTINKIYMVLDCFQLQDNVLKRLNQISAGPDGLSLLFDTYDHSSMIVTGTGSIEAQVQQARSRIVRSYCVVRDTANISNPYINSLCSESPLQRVSSVCSPGYAPYSSPVALTGGNSSGINSSFIILTYPSSTGNTTGGTSFDPLIVSSSTVVPNVYPFIVKSRLPTSPFNSTTSPNGFQTVTSYQAQLGSLFFPQQPLTTVSEFYQNAMYVWNKGIPDKCDLCSVSYNDFIGGLGWYLYDPTTPPTTDDKLWTAITGGSAANNPTSNLYYGNWIAPWGISIYGMLAEKSQALNLSGLPISNARLMRHKLTFATAPMSQGSRTINVFTQYTRVMKLYLGGRLVVRE